MLLLVWQYAIIILIMITLLLKGGCSRWVN